MSRQQKSGLGKISKRSVIVIGSVIANSNRKFLKFTPNLFILEVYFIYFFNILYILITKITELLKFCEKIGFLFFILKPKYKKISVIQ